MYSLFCCITGILPTSYTLSEMKPQLAPLSIFSFAMLRYIPALKSLSKNEGISIRRQGTQVARYNRHHVQNITVNNKYLHMMNLYSPLQSSTTKKKKEWKDTTSHRRGGKGFKQTENNTPAAQKKPKNICWFNIWSTVARTIPSSSVATLFAAGFYSQYVLNISVYDDRQDTALIATCSTEQSTRYDYDLWLICNSFIAKLVLFRLPSIYLTLASSNYSTTSNECSCGLRPFTACMVPLINKPSIALLLATDKDLPTVRFSSTETPYKVRKMSGRTKETV